MKNRGKIVKNLTFIVMSVVFLVFLYGCSAERAPVSRSGFYFDTVIQVSVYDPGKEACLDECMKLADKYEKLFSATVEGSDIWNINHSGGKSVTVSDETLDLLNTALYYCELTNGRIDFTIETVNMLWDFHGENEKNSSRLGRLDHLGKLPDSESINEALRHVDYHNVRINGNTVTLKDPKAAISLGFVAKGYIADKMKEYLLANNVKSAIINLGGNLLAVGNKPDGSAFRFGIQKPFEAEGSIITSLSVSDKSLVSSGVYERYFYQDDVLYHHILDTSTGYPVKNDLLSVTILSDSSTAGDALSTSCFVLGPDAGMELVNSTEGVEAVFITKDYELHYSEGLQDTQD